MDGEFTVSISTESMPNMRGSKKKKKGGKKAPRMVQATFQAGSDDISENQAQPAAATSISESSTMEISLEPEMEFDDEAKASEQETWLANENGFQIALSTNIDEDEEANNHFARMRRQDIEAYEAKQREIEHKFGFEAAQPVPPTNPE